MVRQNGVHHIRAFVILPCQLGAQGYVGAFRLMVNGLADVMEQTGTLGQLHVCAQFRCHHASQVADLDGVLQHVLTVAGAVLEPTQQLHQFVVDAVLIGLKHSILAGFPDLVFHFFASLFHRFLNAGRVDAAVHDQLLHSDAGDFTAHRVEGGYDDGLGGVVDDQIHTGGSFQRTDVAAFTANDPTLHVVIGQGDHRHGAFRHMVGSALLNGQGDDVASLLFALFLGTGFDFPHHGGGVVIGFLLHTLHNDLPCLVLGHGGNPFQLGVLLLGQCLGFFLHFLDVRSLFVQAGFPGLHVVSLLVQGFFPLEQAALVPLNLRPAVADFLIVFRFFPVIFRLSLQDLLLGLQHLFLLVLICLADSIVIQPLGILFRSADFLLGLVLAVCVSAQGAHGGNEQRNEYVP